MTPGTLIFRMVHDIAGAGKVLVLVLKPGCGSCVWFPAKIMKL